MSKVFKNEQAEKDNVMSKERGNMKSLLNNDFDIYNPLAYFLTEMIEKYANDLELENIEVN